MPTFNLSKSNLPIKQNGAKVIEYSIKGSFNRDELYDYLTDLSSDLKDYSDENNIQLQMETCLAFNIGTDKHPKLAWRRGNWTDVGKPISLFVPYDVTDSLLDDIEDFTQCIVYVKKM